MADLSKINLDQLDGLSRQYLENDTFNNPANNPYGMATPYSYTQSPAYNTNEYEDAAYKQGMQAAQSSLGGVARPKEEQPQGLLDWAGRAAVAGGKNLATQALGIGSGLANFAGTLTNTNFGVSDAIDKFSRENFAPKHQWTWEEIKANPEAYATSPEGLVADAVGMAGSMLAMNGAAAMLTKMIPIAYNGAAATAFITGKNGAKAGAAMAKMCEKMKNAPVIGRYMDDLANFYRNTEAGNIMAIGQFSNAIEAMSEGGSAAQEYAEEHKDSSYEDRMKVALGDAGLNLAYLVGADLIGDAGFSRFLKKAGGEEAFKQSFIKSVMKNAPTALGAYAGGVAKDAYDEGVQYSLAEYAKGKKENLVDAFNPFEWADEAKVEAVAGGAGALMFGGPRAAAGMLRTTPIKDTPNRIADETTGNVSVLDETGRIIEDASKNVSVTGNTESRNEEPVEDVKLENEPSPFDYDGFLKQASQFSSDEKRTFLRGLAEANEDNIGHNAAYELRKIAEEGNEDEVLKASADFLKSARDKEIKQFREAHKKEIEELKNNGDNVVSDDKNKTKDEDKKQKLSTKLQKAKDKYESTQNAYADIILKFDSEIIANNPNAKFGTCIAYPSIVDAVSDNITDKEEQKKWIDALKEARNNKRNAVKEYNEIVEQQKQQEQQEQQKKQKKQKSEPLYTDLSDGSEEDLNSLDRSLSGESDIQNNNQNTSNKQETKEHNSDKTTKTGNDSKDNSAKKEEKKEDKDPLYNKAMAGKIYDESDSTGVKSSDVIVKGYTTKDGKRVLRVTNDSVGSIFVNKAIVKAFSGKGLTQSTSDRGSKYFDIRDTKANREILGKLINKQLKDPVVEQNDVEEKTESKVDASGFDESKLTGKYKGKDIEAVMEPAKSSTGINWITLKGENLSGIGNLFKTESGENLLSYSNNKWRGVDTPELRKMLMDKLGIGMDEEEFERIQEERLVEEHNKSIKEAQEKEAAKNAKAQANIDANNERNRQLKEERLAREAAAKAQKEAESAAKAKQNAETEQQQSSVKANRDALIDKEIKAREEYTINFCGKLIHMYLSPVTGKYTVALSKYEKNFTSIGPKLVQLGFKNKGSNGVMFKSIDNKPIYQYEGKPEDLERNKGVVKNSKNAFNSGVSGLITNKELADIEESGKQSVKVKELSPQEKARLKAAETISNNYPSAYTKLDVFLTELAKTKESLAKNIRNYFTAPEIGEVRFMKAMDIAGFSEEDSSGNSIKSKDVYVYSKNGKTYYASSIAEKDNGSLSERTESIGDSVSMAYGVIALSGLQDEIGTEPKTREGITAAEFVSNDTVNSCLYDKQGAPRKEFVSQFGEESQKTVATLNKFLNEEIKGYADGFCGIPTGVKFIDAFKERVLSAFQHFHGDVGNVVDIALTDYEVGQFLLYVENESESIDDLDCAFEFFLNNLCEELKGEIGKANLKTYDLSEINRLKSSVCRSIASAIYGNTNTLADDFGEAKRVGKNDGMKFADWLYKLLGQKEFSKVANDVNETSLVKAYYLWKATDRDNVLSDTYRRNNQIALLKSDVFSGIDRNASAFLDYMNMYGLTPWTLDAVRANSEYQSFVEQNGTKEEKEESKSLDEKFSKFVREVNKLYEQFLADKELEKQYIAKKDKELEEKNSNSEYTNKNQEIRNTQEQLKDIENSKKNATTQLDQVNEELKSLAKQIKESDVIPESIVNVINDVSKDIAKKLELLLSEKEKEVDNNLMKQAEAEKKPKSWVAAKKVAIEKALNAIRKFVSSALNSIVKLSSYKTQKGNTKKLTELYSLLVEQKNAILKQGEGKVGVAPIYKNIAETLDVAVSAVEKQLETLNELQLKEKQASLIKEEAEKLKSEASSTDTAKKKLALKEKLAKLKSELDALKKSLREDYKEDFKKALKGGMEQYEQLIHDARQYLKQDQISRVDINMETFARNGYGQQAQGYGPSSEGANGDQRTGERGTSELNSDLSRETGNIEGSENRPNDGRSGNSGRGRTKNALEETVSNIIKASTSRANEEGSRERTGLSKESDKQGSIYSVAEREVNFGDDSSYDAELCLSNSGTKQHLSIEQTRTVKAIEDRLYVNNGAGFCCADGMGVGKTVENLLVIKRMLASGKKKILVIVPNDGIRSVWLKDGHDFLGFNESMFNKMNNSGFIVDNKINIITKDQMVSNQHLIDNTFDAVFVDECHTIVKGQDAGEYTQTDRSQALRAIIGHKDSLHDYLRFKFKVIVDNYDEACQEVDNLLKEVPIGVKNLDKAIEIASGGSASKRNKILRAIEKLNKAEEVYNERKEAYEEEWQERVNASSEATKTVLISGTPVSYIENAYLLEGIAFDYGKGGYADFMQNKLGCSLIYRPIYRDGELTHKAVAVNTSSPRDAAIALNEVLRENGSISGEKCNPPSSIDYNQSFVLVKEKQFAQIGEFFSSFRSTKDNVPANEQALNDSFIERAKRSGYKKVGYSSAKYMNNKRFASYIKDNHATSAILNYISEIGKAISACEFIEINKALGRKSVVFVKFTEGGLKFNPFEVNKQQQESLLEKLKSDMMRNKKLSEQEIVKDSEYLKEKEKLEECFAEFNELNKELKEELDRWLKFGGEIYTTDEKTGVKTKKESVNATDILEAKFKQGAVVVTGRTSDKTAYDEDHRIVRDPVTGESLSADEYSVRQFQEDNMDKYVFIGSIDKCSEGFNLQDKFGTHPRAMFKLEVPVMPGNEYQADKRIYRYSSASNSIIRYITTGLPNEVKAIVGGNGMGQRIDVVEGVVQGENAVNIGNILKENIAFAINNEQTLHQVIFDDVNGRQMEALKGENSDKDRERIRATSLSYSKDTAENVAAVRDNTIQGVQVDWSKVKFKASSQEDFETQTVFAASRVPFERGDWNYIGSGEGSNVHGWGFYAAKKKYIAYDHYYLHNFLKDELVNNDILNYDASSDELEIITSQLKGNPDKTVQAFVKIRDVFLDLTLASFDTIQVFASQVIAPIEVDTFEEFLNKKYNISNQTAKKLSAALMSAFNTSEAYFNTRNIFNPDGTISESKAKKMIDNYVVNLDTEEVNRLVALDIIHNVFDNITEMFSYKGDGDGLSEFETKLDDALKEININKRLLLSSIGFSEDDIKLLVKYSGKLDKLREQFRRTFAEIIELEEGNSNEEQTQIAIEDVMNKFADSTGVDYYTARDAFTSEPRYFWINIAKKDVREKIVHSIFENDADKIVSIVQNIFDINRAFNYIEFRNMGTFNSEYEEGGFFRSNLYKATEHSVNAINRINGDFYNNLIAPYMVRGANQDDTCNKVTNFVIDNLFEGMDGLKTGEDNIAKIYPTIEGDSGPYTEAPDVDYAFRTLNKARKMLTKINSAVLSISKGEKPVITHTVNASLLKLEVPDDRYLVDESKDMLHQNKFILDALRKIFQEAEENHESYDHIVNIIDYGGPYNAVARAIQTAEQYFRNKYNLSDKKIDIPELTSRVLLANGVQGIKYHGEWDKNCVVIFDEKLFNVSERLYKAGEKSKVAKRTLQEILDEIKGAYKGCKITPTKFGTILIEKPNGKVDELIIQDEIIVPRASAEDAAKAHGLSSQRGPNIEGFFEAINRDGIDGRIVMSKKSSKYSAYHESMHDAIENSLTTEEKAYLFEKFADQAKSENKAIEECICDAYADWCEEQETNTTLGKIFAKIQQFFRKIKAALTGCEDYNNIFKAMYDGEMWGREFKNGKGEAVAPDVHIAQQNAIGNLANETNGVEDELSTDGARLSNAHNEALQNAPIIQLKDNSGSPNIIDRKLLSPWKLAKKFPTWFKEFFKICQSAEEEQEKWRAIYRGRLIDACESVANNKEDAAELQVLMWTEDAAQSVFTNEQLRKMGYSENVIKAHKEIRKLLDDIWEHTNDIQRGYKEHVKFVSSEEAKKLLHNKLAENVRVLVKVKKADGTFVGEWRSVDDSYIIDGHNYSVKYGMARTEGKALNKASEEKLKELQNDENVYIKEVKETKHKDGTVTYQIKYDRRVPNIGKIVGYVPHMFEQFLVIRKRTQEEIIADKYNKDEEVILDSFKTVKEATEFYDEYMKDPKHKGVKPNSIIIRSKEFDVQRDLGTDTADSPSETPKIKVTDDQGKMLFKDAARVYDMTPEEARNLFGFKSLTKASRQRSLAALKERTGQTGFNKDMYKVLDRYVMTASRYIALQPAKYESRVLYENKFGVSFDAQPPDTKASMVREYLAKFNGDPNELETMISDMIDNTPVIGKLLKHTYGERSALALAGWLNGVVSKSTLGLYNIGSAFVSLSQLGLVYTLIGSDATAYAMKAIRNPSLLDKKVLEESNVIYDIGLDSPDGTKRRGNFEIKTQDSTGGLLEFLGTTASKLGDYGMDWFSSADAYCRKVAILGGYYKSRKAGMSHEGALKQAKEINRRANFSYGTADAPGLFRDLSGTVFGDLMLLFKKYPVKATEFVFDVVGHGTMAERKRLVIGYVLMAGLASIPGLDWFDDLIYNMWGFRPSSSIKTHVIERYGNNIITRSLLYGVMSNFGVDVSRRVGLSGIFPQETTFLQWISGVAGSKMTDLVGATANGDYIKALKTATPTIGYLAEAWRGYSIDKNGAIKHKYEGREKLYKAMGFRTIEEAMESDFNSTMYARSTDEKNEKKAFKLKIANKQLEGKRLTKEEVAKLRELGITPKQLAQARKDLRTPSSQRIERGMSDKNKEKHRRLMNEIDGEDDEE